MFPKPDKKKKKRNGIPKKLVAEVHKRSGGICEYCHSRKATDYPHHLNERGMGGGRGLDILINMLDVCPICHNHDDTEFLKWCDKELERRISKAFRGSKDTRYSLDLVADKLKIDYDLLFEQYRKNFLLARLEKIENGFAKTKLSEREEIFAHYEDIKRWLMSKGVVVA